MVTSVSQSPRQGRTGLPSTHTSRGHAVGRNSNVFQPPRTPSISASSSLHLARSATSIKSVDMDESNFISRKRSRREFSVEDKATPLSASSAWVNGVDNEDPMARSNRMDPGSPTPFVNTKYQIAGGFDTPSIAAAKYYGEDSDYSDVGYRRGIGGADKRGFENKNDHSYFSFPRQDISPMEPEQDDLPSVRTPSKQTSSNNSGWSQVALGVVGKVWEFCTAGAFRGFTAGGGSTYRVKPLNSSTEHDFWLDEENEKGNLENQKVHQFTSLPGQFPEEDFIEDYMDYATPDDSLSRPSKRRQVDSGDGPLNKNWVIVSPDIVTNSPSRMSAGYSMPTSSSSSRRNGTATSVARTASRAGGRRPLHANGRLSGVSHAGSPALRATRLASFASPRSPGGSRIPVPTGLSKPDTPASPAAIEAQKWAAIKKKEEKQADESIRRFNAQLQAMIREGKQALGTTVEVEIDGDVGMSNDIDEGFEDGEFHGVGVAKRW